MRKRASNTPDGARRPPAARRRAGRSGARVGALALMILLLAAGCDRLDASTPAIPSPVSPTATPPPPPATVDTQTPSPSPTATPTDEATPTPTPPPEERDEEREAELERLRATNFFVEFAEADRARHATWARFAYHHFAVYEDQEVLFEWANKDELWDSVAPLVRDECLLAGRPATRPMWDAQIVIPASLNPTWNDNDTGGRGYFVDFVCVQEVENGVFAELWVGALIEEEHDHGLLTSVSPPVFVPEKNHSHLELAREEARRQLWHWILEQPVGQGD